MKIALPIDNTLNLYKDNPHTAPKFAIYDIKIMKESIHFSLSTILDNRLSKIKNNEFTNEEKKCLCDTERKENLRHKCDHYSLLEALDGCSYLLANKSCFNTQKSMRIAGITIFTIPPIISEVNMAIKNFIIGGSFANQIKQIHYAS